MDPKNPQTSTAANKTATAQGTQHATTEGDVPEKAKTSKRWRSMLKAEKQLTKAQKRMTKGVLQALDRWELEREKSAHKKKDGAIKDSVANAMKATAKMIRVTADVPRELTKGMLYMYPKSVRKMF